MNFRAVHADGRGRTDSEAGFTSPDRRHGDGNHAVDHNRFADPRVKTNMAVPPCQGEEVPRGWVPDHDRDVPRPGGSKRRGRPDGLAAGKRLTLQGYGFSKREWDRFDILAPARTRRIVLLRTLDVRQIRRTVLGMRKAPGMKSTKGEHRGSADR
jgi:hypothetical protein